MKGAWGSKTSLAQVMRANLKDVKVVDPAIAAQAPIKRVPLPQCAAVDAAHRYVDSEGNDGSTAYATTIPPSIPPPASRPSHFVSPARQLAEAHSTERRHNSGGVCAGGARYGRPSTPVFCGCAYLPLSHRLSVSV
jgi:hypothetical protein